MALSAGEQRGKCRRRSNQELKVSNVDHKMVKMDTLFVMVKFWQFSCVRELSLGYSYNRNALNCNKREDWRICDDKTFSPEIFVRGRFVRTFPLVGEDNKINYRCRLCSVMFQLHLKGYIKYRHCPKKAG
jgi:hypothetical protein